MEQLPKSVIEKYHLKNKKWIYKGFHGVLHTFFINGRHSLNPLKEFLGDSFSFTIFFVEKDYVHWYWNEEEMTRIRNLVIKKVEENKRFLPNLLKEWHKRLKAFRKVYSRIDPTKFNKYSDLELIDSFEKMYDAYLHEYGLAIGMQDAFSMTADKFIEPEFIQELPKENFNQNYVLLLSSVNGSFINVELRQRYRLLQEILKNRNLKFLFINENDAGEIFIQVKKKFKRFSKHLHSHVLDYHWIQNNYAKTPYLDEIFFIRQLKKLVIERVDPVHETKKLVISLKETLAKKRQLIKQLNLSQNLRNLIKIVEVFTYMQDERKKYVLIANYYQKQFREEVGKRVGLSSKEMDYTIMPEIRNILLKHEFDNEQLKKRHEFCIVFQNLDGYFVASGKTAKSIYSKVYGENKEIHEIKGMAASLGKVRGPVRIIRKTHDLLSMTDGDILVASMTRPEMISAIQKAAAIVTDEGGITCHAAIVSREMHIPCIIGTKNATQILKDGDLVEVDADNGIVRKL